MRKLVAGPGVYICDYCINVCRGILDKEFGAIKPMCTQELKLRLDLLRQVRDGEILPDKDYQSRVEQLVIDVQQVGDVVLMSFDEIKERLDLLRQLRDGEAITEENYRSLARQLLVRI